MPIMNLKLFILPNLNLFVSLNYCTEIKSLQTYSIIHSFSLTKYGGKKV